MRSVTACWHGWGTASTSTTSRTRCSAFSTCAPPCRQVSALQVPLLMLTCPPATAAPCCALGLLGRGGEAPAPWAIRPRALAHSSPADSRPALLTDAVPAGGAPRMEVVGMQPGGWRQALDATLKLLSPLYVSAPTRLAVPRGPVLAPAALVTGFPDASSHHSQQPPQERTHELLTKTSGRDRPPPAARRCCAATLPTCDMRSSSCTRRRPPARLAAAPAQRAASRGTWGRRRQSFLRAGARQQQEATPLRQRPKQRRTAAPRCCPGGCRLSKCPPSSQVGGGAAGTAGKACSTATRMRALRPAPGTLPSAPTRLPPRCASSRQPRPPPCPPYAAVWGSTGIIAGKTCPTLRKRVLASNAAGRPVWVSAESYAVLLTSAGPPPSR